MAWNWAWRTTLRPTAIEEVRNWYDWFLCSGGIQRGLDLCLVFKNKNLLIFQAAYFLQWYLDDTILVSLQYHIWNDNNPRQNNLLLSGKRAKTFSGKKPRTKEMACWVLGLSALLLVQVYLSPLSREYFRGTVPVLGLIRLLFLFPTMMFLFEFWVFLSLTLAWLGLNWVTESTAALLQCRDGPLPISSTTVWNSSTLWCLSLDGLQNE